MYQRYQPPQSDLKSARFSNQSAPSVNYRPFNSYNNTHNRHAYRPQQHPHQSNQRLPLHYHQQQQQQQPQNLPPLTYSYSVDDATNWKFRKFRSILNKITPETFDKLSRDIINVGLNSPQILRGVIHLIFDKAIRDSKFCALYAELCQVLCNEAPNYETQPGPNTFCKILITKCESEFDRRRQASKDFDGRTNLTEDEFEQKAVAKQNMLANIKFICELRKNDFIEESIIHECIKELLSKNRKPLQDLSEDLECLCQIMRTIGSLLDVKASKNLMNQYFDRMELFSRKQELPSRVRFMLKDVIDLRSNNWRPRPFQREETNPQLISKIREESLYQPTSGSLSSALERICSSRNLIGKNELVKLHGNSLSLLLDDDEPSFTTSYDHFGPGPPLLPLDQPVMNAYSSHKPQPNLNRSALSTSSPPSQNLSSVSSKTMTSIKNSHSTSNMKAINHIEFNKRQSTSVPLNTLNGQNLDSIDSSRDKKFANDKGDRNYERSEIKLSNQNSTNQPIGAFHRRTFVGRDGTNPGQMRFDFTHPRERDIDREIGNNWQQNQKDILRERREYFKESGRTYVPAPSIQPQPQIHQQQLSHVHHMSPPLVPRFDSRIDRRQGHDVSETRRPIKFSNFQEQQQPQHYKRITNEHINHFSTNNNEASFNRNITQQHRENFHQTSESVSQLNSDNNMNWRQSSQSSTLPAPTTRYQEPRPDRFNPNNRSKQNQAGSRGVTLDGSQQSFNKSLNFVSKNINFKNQIRIDTNMHKNTSKRNERMSSKDSFDRPAVNHDHISGPFVMNTKRQTPPPIFLSNTSHNDTNVSLRPSYNLTGKTIGQASSSSQPTTPVRSPKSPNYTNMPRNISDNLARNTSFGTLEQLNKLPQNIATQKNSETPLDENLQTATNNNSSSKDRQREIIIGKFDSILNEYLEHGDLGNSIAKIKELKISKSNQQHCLIGLMKKSIKEDDKYRDNMSRLVSDLVPSVFDVVSLMNTLRTIFKEMQALEVEIPKVKSNVAGLLSKAIADGLLTLQEVGEILKDGKYHPLFLICLQRLEKLLGQAQVSEKFNSSKINLMNMLPEADQTQERLVSILKDRCLGFLCPMLTVEPDLWSQMVLEDSSPSSIYRWIKENVGLDLQSSPIFASVFISCLLRYIFEHRLNKSQLQLSRSSENLPSQDNPSSSASEITELSIKNSTQLSSQCDIVTKEQLTKYQPILQAILANKSMQLATLYASQGYFHSINSPKGLILRWFHLLYELNIVDEEIFFTWKEEINDEIPGKGQALFQVNSWLNWLAEAESDEDEEEDEE